MEETWEVYSLNKGFANLDEQNFATFRKVLVQGMEKRQLEFNNKNNEILSSTIPLAVCSVPGMLKRSRNDNDDMRMSPPPSSKNSLNQRRVSMSPNLLQMAANTACLYS